MKAEIHPIYNEAIAFTCACGNAFTVGSTAEKIDVEVCSNCHPFYTGKQKLLDAAGRVDKFRQRQEEFTKMAKATKSARAEKSKKTKKNTPNITKLG
jgi:large subunit ribosomal protein L31